MGWNVITCGRRLGGFAIAAVLAVASVWAAESSVTSAVSARDGSAPETTLAAYRALSASQARDYDRRQDISPWQLVILLEVSERADASLGQALATGEQESARTWNDHVRPTLKSGRLGAATGVWQFQPATFHRIVKEFGARLLAASAADVVTGRQPMDLGAGPFTDAQVRGLIRETVDGRRGADDAQLQLLRHNFAVLAFAKHYLSVESGAATPEEDYLFHFLGEGQGRRILTLARGEARDTLCVKPVGTPSPAREPAPERLARAGALALPPVVPAPARLPSIDVLTRPRVALELGPKTKPGPPAGGAKGSAKKKATAQRARPPAASGLLLTLPANAGVPTVRLQLRGEPGPDLGLGRGRRAAMQPAAAELPAFEAAPESALFYPTDPSATTPVSAEWGLPADSPTVTGNLGMFYRDGAGQTQPYTWAEFLDHLGKSVRAADQPALVRAKYGVGFQLKGGDMPEWAFDPEQVSSAAAFRYTNGQTVLVPEAMVTGTLDRYEARRYKERLAELVRRGEDQPLDALPQQALAALHHLGLLDPNVQSTDTQDPRVRRALHDFRTWVGKDEPDDPEHAGRLMPAERVALELYEKRIAHYATLQAVQDAALGVALNIPRVPKLPARFQRLAAPQVAAVQAALADLGLLAQPTQKTVWRDKKRKKHTSTKMIPFPGKPDKATVAALNTFQLRHGLRQTDGAADAVTLQALGLPPIGLEVFLPPSGPCCAVEGDSDAAPRCEVRARPAWGTLGVVSPNRPRVLPRILDGSPGPGGRGRPATSNAAGVGDHATKTTM